MRQFEKILAVPGLSQRDNKLYPSSTCNTTSLAMVGSYFGIHAINPNEQLEDVLTQMTQEDWAKKLAVSLEGKAYADHAREVWAVLKALIEKFPAKIDHADIDGYTLDDLRDHIDAGRPVIMGGRFPCGDGFIGHFQVLIGYTDNGKTFIVNDPWGNPNTKYADHNGVQVKISEEHAESWWRNNNATTKLGIVVYGK